jgi:hypothetical protein
LFRIPRLPKLKMRKYRCCFPANSPTR